MAEDETPLLYIITRTIQQHLDEMTRFSSSLTKIMSLNSVMNIQQR